MSTKDILQRSFTMLFFVPIFLFGISFNELTYCLTFFFVLLGCLYENLNFYNTFLSKFDVFYTINLGILSYLISFFVVSGRIESKFFAIIPIFSLLLMVKKLCTNDISTFKTMPILFFSQHYIVLPFCIMHAGVFKNGIFSPMSIYITLIAVWVTDVGAYFGGMFLGKHHVFNKISPKKTLEGALCGFFLSIIVFFLLRNRISLLDNCRWVIFSTLLSLSAVCGDLVESIIKRNAEVKVSGMILPGHGGVLDRFDSFLFAIVICNALLFFF